MPNTKGMIDRRSHSLQSLTSDCRLNKQCDKFVHDNDFLKKGEDFFTDTPHPESAIFMVAWIMNRYFLEFILLGFRY
jgi:hypothetical protein